MSSQKTSQGGRAPSRRRGHERVATLLAAASACFVEKGFDAATMTEIAARAEASIGSLYQFFPTKEALAEALLSEHANGLNERMERLVAQTPDWTTEELAARLIRTFVDYRKQHPAMVTLTEVAGALPSMLGRTIRQRMRDYLSQILAIHAPRIPAGELRPAAMVVQQMMKAAVALESEQPATLRKAAQNQLQQALALYLTELASRS
ncbi:HTH-type transcriptional repressor Bm3R1 [Dyella sp. AD56]|uniref:TetR/AcrR family transcriptional regulator n=1 Tax=Dyella sp. AD56 TaxID=1528744 RepID=UPI000CB6FF19|nr:TetR/AcrR family transcriptional regulator [Dyella sp. AD56]PMQ05737.1 HTH-type transcriptional repressor Bm3R1 [Dyella sp. AD56]